MLNSFNVADLFFYMFLPISFSFSMWITILLTIYRYNRNIFNWYAIEKNKDIFWQLIIIQYLLFIEWYLPKSSYLSYNSSFLNLLSLAIIVLFFGLITIYLYEKKLFSLYFSWFINLIFLTIIFIVLLYNISRNFASFNINYTITLLLELVMLFYIIFCCIMLGIYFFLLWRRFNNIGIYYLIMVFSFWGILSIIIYSITNYNRVGFSYFNIIYYSIIFLMFLTTYYLVMNNKLSYNKKHQLWGILFLPAAFVSFFVIYKHYNEYVYKYNLIDNKYNPLIDISVIINGLSILVWLFIIFFILKVLMNLVNWKIYV